MDVRASRGDERCVRVREVGERERRNLFTVSQSTTDGGGDLSPCLAIESKRQIVT